MKDVDLKEPVGEPTGPRPDLTIKMITDYMRLVKLERLKKCINDYCRELFPRLRMR